MMGSWDVMARAQMLEGRHPVPKGITDAWGEAIKDNPLYDLCPDGAVRVLCWAYPAMVWSRPHRCAIDGLEYAPATDDLGLRHPVGRLEWHGIEACHGTYPFEEG